MRKTLYNTAGNLLKPWPLPHWFSPFFRRHVLGGKKFIAPSDKITLAYIGIGTQGIRELLPLLANTQFQVIAVCDPNKEAIGYKDWAKDWLKE